MSTLSTLPRRALDCPGASSSPPFHPQAACATAVARTGTAAANLTGPLCWHAARLQTPGGAAIARARTAVSRARCALSDRARSFRDVSRARRQLARRGPPRFVEQESSRWRDPPVTSGAKGTLSRRGLCHRDDPDKIRSGFSVRDERRSRTPVAGRPVRLRYVRMRRIVGLAIAASWLLVGGAGPAEAQTVGRVPEPGDWMALARIALGFLLVGVGLASSGLAFANRRVSIVPLSAFGALALLYGSSFLVASSALAPLFGVSRQTLVFLSAFIYYVLPIPGLIYAEQVRGPGWHGALRRLWQLSLPLAVAFVTYDLATDTPFASFRVYGIYVTAVMAILLLHVVLWRQRDPVETTARTLGTGLLVLSIIHDNLVAFGVLPWRVSLQVVGATALLLSLGFVTLRRLLADQRELAAVERELTMATRIQTAILPRDVPTLAGLRIAVRYVPSRFVAGDVYGFHAIDAHRLGVLIADVTGHGVPAALIASMTTAVFAAQIDRAADPGRVLSAMNRALAGRFDGQFVSAAYAVIDAGRRALKYSVAGHPPPFLYRQASATLVPLADAGLVLGVLPDVEYSTSEQAFQPGDRLVLYTDGVSEARNARGEWFGDEALAAFAVREASLSTDAFIHQLLTDVERWTGHSAAGQAFEDDLTIVVVDAERRD